MAGKIKEKLNIHFKFNDVIGEEKSDEILFRVFDILLSSQKGQKEPKTAEKINENNRNTISANKSQ